MSIYDVEDPPSYDSAVSPSGPSSNAPIQLRVQREVHSQLSSLGQQISRAQGRRLQDLYDRDQQLLNLLIPLINNFLEDYSKSGVTRAQLIVVPASRVSQDATPADDDLISDDEFSRVERISGEYKGQTFWDDQDVARRVVTYLQPETDANLERSPGETPAGKYQPQASPNEKKRPFWQKAAPQTRAPASAALTPQEYPDEKHSGNPQVTMAVTTEQVAFRTQTPFGLYGTESGWGIVVRIVVHLK